MGINCLLPFVKNHLKSVNIKVFKGKLVAVDASCWLHKALSVSMSRTGSFSSYLEICRGYIEVLTRNGVVPFLVFDGLPLPAKSLERDERRRVREKRLEESEVLENMGKMQDSWSKKSQAASVVYEHIAGLIEICIEKKIQYIVAPFEADAELAYLSSSGHVDAVLTEDSDLLAYGCKKVLFKLKLSGEADLADLDYILQTLNLNSSQFLSMCIVAGCDFLPNIKGIGIHRASQLVTRNDFLDELSRNRYAPPDYCTRFKQACAVFKHQAIYDLDCKKVRALTAWGAGEEKAQFSMACGKFSQTDCVADFVKGNVDMATMEKKNTFPTQQVILPSTDLSSGVPGSEPEPQLDSQQRLRDIPDRIDVYVERIEDGLLKWKIPCFPVMEVEFICAWAIINGQRKKILLSKDSSRLKCPANVGCTSYCTITIKGENYFVMWNFQENTTIPEQNDSEQLDLIPINQNVNVTHTLPFKVMGVAYSKQAQDQLEAAYEHLYNAKGIVYAKVFPEPENAHDNKAIAVSIKHINDDWCKIGYIAAELTKYLHAVWSDGLDFEVNVKHINFRTTYMKVGFYITINLTRKGEWEPEVIRAAKKVQ